MSDAADIDRKEMVASSTGIRAGSMEQARSVRAGDKQVAREGNDEGLGMGPRGRGVLPYMGYIGRCRCEGYGFQAVYSRIGYINQSVWV